jgi:3-octaprenyl-4-hydroxybenzoate carboxy-lyase
LDDQTSSAAAAGFAGWLARAEAQGRLRRIVLPSGTQAQAPAVAWRVRRDRAQAALFEGAPAGEAAHRGGGLLSQALTGRADWAIALGLEAPGLLRALLERLDGRLAPGRVAAPQLRRVAVPVLPRPDAALPELECSAGVLALGEGAEAALFLVRLIRSPGAALSICLDTPRLLDALGEAGAARPASLLLGCHPAIYLAAAMGSFGRAADFGLAGALAASPIDLIDLAGRRCVPADVQAVLIGAAGGQPLRRETVPGLSGRARAEVPVSPMVVDEAFAAAQPVIYLPHIGAAPSDWDGIAGLALELLTAAHLANIEGGLDLQDLACVPGSGHQILAISLRPRVPGQAKTALLAALSGPFPYFTGAIAVDPDVDAGRLEDLVWAVASRTHAQTDVCILDGAGVLAQTVDSEGDGSILARSKWMIDATVPVMPEDPRRLFFERARSRNGEAVRLADFL